MEGKGTFSWADGRKYIGNYLMIKKPGRVHLSGLMEENTKANGIMGNSWKWRLYQFFRCTER